MAASKVNTYISLELEWLELKLKQTRQAIDNYDLDNLIDRYGPRAMPNGKIVDALVSSKEDQLKTVMIILEKLPKMLQGLAELREKEARSKIITKGDVEISGIMEEE